MNQLLKVLLGNLWSCTLQQRISPKVLNQSFNGIVGSSKLDGCCFSEDGGRGCLFLMLHLQFLESLSRFVSLRVGANRCIPSLVNFCLIIQQLF